MSHFIESEALLALTRDDEEEAEAQVRKLTKTEALRLAEQASTLAEMCRMRARRASDEDRDG